MTVVVDEARRWIGTPYVHQASMRGAGTDCLGLIRGVWRAVYGGEPEKVPAYTMDWSEPQGLETLWEAALRHMRPISAGVPLVSGQCLLFRMREQSVAKHLGIVASAGALPTFVHAYSGQGVVESALSRPWKRRVAARFDFPELPPQED
ncbi:MAG: peptidase [Pseudomonadota bacterium]